MGRRAGKFHGLGRRRIGCIAEGAIPAASLTTLLPYMFLKDDMETYRLFHFQPLNVWSGDSIGPGAERLPSASCSFMIGNYR
jgi:hypothetical protein